MTVQQDQIPRKQGVSFHVGNVKPWGHIHSRRCCSGGSCSGGGGGSNTSDERFTGWLQGSGHGWIASYGLTAAGGGGSGNSLPCPEEVSERGSEREKG